MDDAAYIPLPTVFQQWDAYRRHGILPRPGGWNNQPVRSLAHIQAIDTAYNAYQINGNKQMKFEDMTATQQQVFLWLEEDLQDG